MTTRFISRGHSMDAPTISFVDNDRSPSWQVRGEGTSFLGFTLYGHKSPTPNLSITGREVAFKGNDATYTKEVLLGLNTEEAVALRDFLNEHFPAGLFRSKEK